MTPTVKEEWKIRQQAAQAKSAAAEVKEDWNARQQAAQAKNAAMDLAVKEEGKTRQLAAEAKHAARQIRKGMTFAGSVKEEDPDGVAIVNPDDAAASAVAAAARWLNSQSVIPTPEDSCQMSGSLTPGGSADYDCHFQNTAEAGPAVFRDSGCPPRHRYGCAECPDGSLTPGGSADYEYNFQSHPAPGHRPGFASSTSTTTTTSDPAEASQLSTTTIKKITTTRTTVQQLKSHMHQRASPQGDSSTPWKDRYLFRPVADDPYGEDVPDDPKGMPEDESDLDSDAGAQPGDENTNVEGEKKKKKTRRGKRPKRGPQIARAKIKLARQEALAEELLGKGLQLALNQEEFAETETPASSSSYTMRVASAATDDAIAEAAVTQQRFAELKLKKQQRYAELKRRTNEKRRKKQREQEALNIGTGTSCGEMGMGEGTSRADMGGPPLMCERQQRQQQQQQQQGPPLVPGRQPQQQQVMLEGKGQLISGGKGKMMEGKGEPISGGKGKMMDGKGSGWGPIRDGKGMLRTSHGEWPSKEWVKVAWWQAMRGGPYGSKGKKSW
eukprot:TRINITY_DN2972_c0_g2_i2.p1 TRINITY_DN2972_c0_g2~~TRINITY_DN2972_c0_g2_i2.p1  ORF type:complete len:554 (-),score=124.28 TRINITY_DN2972_c0_g2_i2:138-1799(-)